jgi:hypothetical protein
MYQVELLDSRGIAPGERSGALPSRFPTNPEPGYIDGSVYLAAIRNPVDVKLLRFGAANGDVISTHLERQITYEYELCGVAQPAADR